MISTLVAIGPLFFLLVVSEVLWRAKVLRGEPARKLLHIIIGSYVASWAFFLTPQHIEFLSALLFIGVVVSHRFKIFHAILDVKRKTWGDLFYALGIGLTALLSQSPWIFAVAILHMSIGDGLAGLIGAKYGKKFSKGRYTVFGQQKSVAGSLAFAVSSVIILAIIVPGPLHIALGSLGPLAVVLPLVATVAENFGIYGSDNITVPLLLTVTLNMLV